MNASSGTRESSDADARGEGEEGVHPLGFTGFTSSEAAPAVFSEMSPEERRKATADAQEERRKDSAAMSNFPRGERDGASGVDWELESLGILAQWSCEIDLVGVVPSSVVRPTCGVVVGVQIQ